MNKQCPNCASPDIYRRHPHSLEICCDNCNRRWQAKQVLAPILRDKLWLSTPLKGWHCVEVWRSPTDPKKFAYRLAYSASLFGELKGEFDAPELALEAGIEEAKRLPEPVPLTELEQLKETALQSYIASRNSCSSDAEHQQVYSAYLEELERIERLALSIKIRESQP